MLFKAGIIAFTLLVGSLAFPAQDDMSIFFDHTDPESRIVGGVTAGPVPWMVGLSQGSLVRSFVCGGSIITNRHILTAAHCVDHVFSGGRLSSTLRATVGTNRWNSGGTSYTLARNISHPNYVSSIIKNDLSFLVTTNNIVFNNNIAPVVLSYNNVGTGVQTRVNGWGRIRTGGSLATNLMELRSTVVDNNFCVETVARVARELRIAAPAVQPHLEICTFVAVNQGTCNGDSGSALVRHDNNQQVGIVSWGLPCARGAPDMFARVSAYRSWIENALRQ
ncbi:chymotrypsin-1-like [Colias croceus]|uniref:chymotrypsin-1-like n=1 Tax=Colias crocea TaxID=72248 RepID=UPI001E27FD39|nr:chymotrypsin-1-like [Colias croceus]